MCSVTNCVPVKTITLQQMPKGTGGREALGTGPSAAPPPTLRLPHPLSMPAALRNACNPASAVSSQAAFVHADELVYVFPKLMLRMQTCTAATAAICPCHLHTSLH